MPPLGSGNAGKGLKTPKKGFYPPARASGTRRLPSERRLRTRQPCPQDRGQLALRGTGRASCGFSATGPGGVVQGLQAEHGIEGSSETGTPGLARLTPGRVFSCTRFEGRTAEGAWSGAGAGTVPGLLQRRWSACRSVDRAQRICRRCQHGTAGCECCQAAIASPLPELRVDSGRGQNRTLRLLSALWPPVFAGEQNVGPPRG